jgi:demethylmenaquinone methyltransferase/2-methoxy-6-polyprenyl-1,4-benzoquinol methylase
MNKKTKVQNMFDSIAGKYDFLNHFLSAGVDIYWRNKAIRLSKMNENSILLDVACGTGDFALTAQKKGVKNIYGADLSFEMLKLFNKKSEYSKGRILQMTAENAPFKSESFTNITVAFGVRNFYDIQQSFNVFYDILKQGGKATILEFSLPKNKFFLAVYNFYFNNVLPSIGRFFSKDKEAYKYLPDSVKEFDETVNLPELFKNSGFSKVTVYPLTFGIAQITIAEK